VLEVVGAPGPGLHKPGARIHQIEQGVPDRVHVHAAVEVGHMARERDLQVWVSTGNAAEEGAVEVAVVVKEGLDRDEGQELWDQDRGGTLVLDGHQARHRVKGSSLQLS